MIIEAMSCPVCGEGRLVEHSHEQRSKFDTYEFVVRGLLHSVCDHCNEWVTTPGQSRHNKRTLIQARHDAVVQFDRARRLKPADILRVRKCLDLTQSQAARVFGGGINAFSKYENGEVEPSDGMDRLLRLAEAVPAASRWLVRRAGLPLELIPDSQRASRLAILRTFGRMAHDAGRVTSTTANEMYLASGIGNDKTYRASQFVYHADDAANDPLLPAQSELAAVG